MISDEGCVPCVVREIDRRALVQEEPRRGLVAEVAGKAEGCVTFVVHEIDRRALLQEKPHRGLVAELAGDEQWRDALTALRVDQVPTSS